MLACPAGNEGEAIAEAGFFDRFDEGLDDAGGGELIVIQTMAEEVRPMLRAPEMAGSAWICARG